MPTSPLFVMEDIDTTPRRDLFTLFGVRWTATPLAWMSLVAQIGLGVVVSVVATFITGGTLVSGLLLGVLWGILITLTASLHSIGHILGGLYVGSPMQENLVTASRQVNIYRHDPATLPSRIHLGRALGGPLLNIIVGLIVLLLLALDGGTNLTLLFFAGINLAIGLGAFAPFPSVDGEVIWRELLRRR